MDVLGKRKEKDELLSLQLYNLTRQTREEVQNAGFSVSRILSTSQVEDRVSHTCG